MKKMRRLIPAIAMLLVSAVMLSTASFAWFSMSTKASATGMTVKATADSSLVILDSKGKTLQVGDFNAAKSTVSLAPTGDVTTLSPAKISTTGALTTLDGDSVAKVDPSTGAAPSDAVWIEAAENTNYYDYVVAVGAVGASVTGTLTATITADVQMLLHKATSIAFYYTLCTNGQLANDDNYVGTVLFANIPATTDTITQEIVAIEDLLTVDEEALGDYVLVTMRVFFDGDAADAQGNIYAKNSNVTVENITFNVDFTVENATTEEVTTEEETTEDLGA